jgi:hypothetical protein
VYVERAVFVDGSAQASAELLRQAGIEFFALHRMKTE